MSQVTQLPPPPIGPTTSAESSTRYVLFAVILLLGSAVVWELKLVNSTVGKEAAQRIREDARVRAEFGDDIHLPFAFGWRLGDQAALYGYVSGKHSHGYAVASLREQGGKWVISGLTVRDPNEGHLINLDLPEPAAKPDQLQVPGSLYFVALGEAATSDVGDLASFLQKEFAIPVKVLPPMTLPEEAYDAPRKQWVAEMLVQAMAAKYPEIAADHDAIVVGIVEDDLYIRSWNWSFTYSYRADNKYSVIPVARLDPAFSRFPPNPAIRMERLRKVAMKAVGLLYLGFEESANPQSVDAIEASVEDIDRMGSVYLAADARTHAANAAANANPSADGTPCLTFYSSHVAGMPLHKPIVPCWQDRDENEGTQYQIDLSHGRFQLTRNDLYRGGPLPLLLQRMNFSYHFDDKVRAFGKSSWQNIDDTVWSADPSSIQTISIYGVLFSRITPGTGFSTEARYRAGPNAGGFSNALLSWQAGGWRIDTRGGEVWRYLGCGPNTRVQCYFMSRSDFGGDGIEVRRDLTTGHIQQVLQKTNANFPAAAALDHTWSPLYDGEKIAEIHDSDGHTAHYNYDREEYLTDVDADGHRVHYDYDGAHRIVRVVEDGRLLRIRYDSEGRPDRVDFPNGSVYSVRYSEQAIEVSGPDANYTVTALPTFFRTLEHK